MEARHLIQRAFLRGFKTGCEYSISQSTESSTNSKIYKIGEVLEDGYLYAGKMVTDKGMYHISVAPNDENNDMSWEDAIKLDIPSKKEWTLISINHELFNFKDRYYWSSTEFNSYYAVIYGPQYGSSAGSDKAYNSLVRCVRRF